MKKQSTTTITQTETLQESSVGERILRNLSETQERRNNLPSPSNNNNPTTNEPAFNNTNITAPINNPNTGNGADAIETSNPNSSPIENPVTTGNEVISNANTTYQETMPTGRDSLQPNTLRLRSTREHFLENERMLTRLRAQNNTHDPDPILQNIEREGQRIADEMNHNAAQRGEQTAVLETIGINMQHIHERGLHILADLNTWMQVHPNLSTSVISSILIAGGLALFRGVTGRGLLSAIRHLLTGGVQVPQIPLNTLQLPINPSIGTGLINPHHAFARFIPELNFPNAVGLGIVIQGARRGVRRFFINVLAQIFRQRF